MASQLVPSGTIGFGDFTLDLRTGELRRNGIVIRLQPQPAKILLVLVSRAGEIVTRNELAEQVWGSETFVDFEHGLNYAIRQIRSALTDDVEQPRFLETIPKRGYRFVAPVRTILEQDPAARGRQSNSESPHQPSRAPGPAIRAALIAVVILGALGALVLAIWKPSARALWSRFVSTGSVPARGRDMLVVLPFENLSGDASQEYFSDGLTEEVITQLGKNSSERLGVIARTTSMSYKNAPKDVRLIGKQLGVDYLLEGSVRRQGARIRVTAQLIRCADGTHMWADAYDSDMRDVLTLQANLARAVAQQVQSRMQPSVTIPVQASEPAASLRSVIPDAYESYLEARYHWNRRNDDDLKQAARLYEQAIQQDPSYAPAYAGLADTYALLGQYGVVPPSDAQGKSKAAASKALLLDPSLPDAHASLANIALLYEYDWPAAEREFRRAIELNPNYASARQWYSEYLVANDRTDEAVQQMTRALEADPNSLIINMAAGRPYYYAGQYDRAMQQFRRSLERDPNFFPAHAMLARAYTEKRMFPEAIAEVQKASALSHGNPSILAELAYTYARSGRKTESVELLSQLKDLSRRRYVPSYSMALVYCGLSQNDEALRLLDRAYQERSSDMIQLPHDPRFNPLRSDPRFHALLQRIGLPGQAH